MFRETVRGGNLADGGSSVVTFVGLIVVGSEVVDDVVGLVGDRDVGLIGDRDVGLIGD